MTPFTDARLFIRLGCLGPWADAPHPIMGLGHAASRPVSMADELAEWSKTPPVEWVGTASKAKLTYLVYCKVLAPPAASAPHGRCGYSWIAQEPELRVLLIGTICFFYTVKRLKRKK